MAFTKTPFDLNAALSGATNIWTRDEQLVRFGGYNEDAATNEQVSVWIGDANTPASYPVSGLSGQGQNDALDLLMYTQDNMVYINLFLNAGAYYTQSETVYADRQSAETAGNGQPNYNQTIAINYQTPYNNPNIPQ